jgi:hypothetical protein
MVQWRWWRTTSSDEPVYTPFTLPTVEEAADDGEAMSIQAGLMSLKNKILVQAITGEDGFDPSLFLDSALEILEDLVKESRSQAAFIQEDIKRAQGKRGEAQYRNDYRRGDLGNLTTRRDTLEMIADRLVDHSENEAWVEEFIRRAHAMAWGELAREMERSLDRTEVMVFGDENYEQEREKRLKEFKNINLAQLIEENTPEY